jgi:hypothetical protein
MRGMFGGLGPTVLKGAVNNCIRYACFAEVRGGWSPFSLISSFILISVFTCRRSLELSLPQDDPCRLWSLIIHDLKHHTDDSCTDD